MSTYKPTVIIAGRENQLDDPDGLDVAHLANVDYVDFDITYADGVSEGRLQWNSADGTLEVGMPGGAVNLQIGQEILYRARNTTGNTINNGTVVYPAGSSGNKLLLGVASNDSGIFPSNQPFAITTENIPHNGDGYVTVFGQVRSMNTNSWNEGDLLFLGTNGGLTDTPPDAPNVTALCAAVVRKHETEGSIVFRWGNGYALNTLADVYAPFGGSSDGDTIGWVTANNRYELYNPGDPGPYTKAAFYNGTFRESFDFLLSSNGTAITGTLQKSGGGDLTMQFSDGESTLDCTPAQTLNITPGTDSSPIGYMVYIPQDTKTLTIATEWPVFTQHIKVAYILVPSATYVLDHGGGYVNQNWNDHLSSGGATANDQGHLAHIGVRIRQMGADWYSGVSANGADDSYFTINTGNVYWQSTEGVVSQFHPHTFTAKDTSGTDLAIVVNDPNTTYNHVQNLYTDITEDSTGTTIQNNRYFNLVFWGVANKTGDGDWVMINLPSGFYSLVTSAINDEFDYDDYNFPREFDIESGTAFLICRVTFQMGTTGWTWIQTEDLRGLSPNKAAGGVGTNDHGSLGGLADDDHTQYALVDGTRAFTGNVSVQGTVNAYAYDTGNYRIDEANPGAMLQIVNQHGGGDFILDFMPNKNGGDGEDDTFLKVWATGGVSYELLTFGYDSDSTPQRYTFRTSAIGGGVHHPIYFEHSGSDVMYVDSNGLNVLSGSEIAVTPNDDATTVKDVAAYEWIGTQNGTMKIRQGWTTYGIMSQTVIRGYNHVGDHPGPWELRFGGYNWVSGPSWDAQGCTVLGNPPFQSVRCGFESGYMVILLGLDGQTAGETATAWNFPWVEIESVTCSETYGGSKIVGKGSGWAFDISEDEATDWPSITGLEDCPMFIAPGMEITDNGDGTANWELSGNTLTVGDAEVAKVLNATKTIYIRTTGNDSNGGYAGDDAFLTPGRAITELHKWIAEDYFLNVNIGQGTFNCAALLDSSYAYGSHTKWTGNATEYTSQTINNIDGSATALSTGLEYIDFDVTLPAGSGAAVGQFILVKTTSGGTNPNLVKGCHEIVTWNGTTNIATVRCVRTDGVTTLPSGTITVNTLTLVRTILNFSASHGIYAATDLHCGTWDNMVFSGSLNYNGIWLTRGASISLGTNFGTSKWATNLLIQYGSQLQGDGSVHSYSDGYVVTVSSGSFASLRLAVILSGCRTNAIRTYDGSSINFQAGEVYCGGTTLNVQATRGGFINAISSIVEGCTPSASIAFYVTAGGGIDSSSSSDDAVTSRDQEAAPGGNGSYHVY
jgi:ribosomal protein L27